ncbi:MAG: hypothetical protein VX498_14180 [Myxococcota bacterium]|nr:hypothetical protein [Myxococcota bacterium]
MLKPWPASPNSTRRKGQAQTEYVIILVAIAVTCTAITVAFGGRILDLFSDADSELAGMVGATGLAAPGVGDATSTPPVSSEEGGAGVESADSRRGSASASGPLAGNRSRGGASASSSGRARKSNDEDGSIVRSGDTVITSAPVRPREGTQELGDGSSGVTVMSARKSQASWDATDRTSANAQMDARTRARVRDEAQWGRKRNAALAAEGETAIAAGPGGLVGFTRMLLLGALLLGLVLLGRAVLGGRGAAAS